MISNAPTITFEETPAFIPAGDDVLFGILTSPTGPARGTTVVLLNAGAWIPAVGKNRLWVRLARRLAEDGYHVLRFDYHGVGESTGTVDAYALDSIFERDLASAVGWLGDRGMDRVVLAGWCFGARLGLMCAPRIPGVEGLIALSLLIVESEGVVLDGGANPPVLKRAFKREAIRRMLHKQYRGIYWRVAKGQIRRIVSKLALTTRLSGRGVDRWASRGFLKDMKATIADGVGVLAVFGSDEPFYEYFQEARAGALGKLLDEAGSLVSVEVLGRDIKRLVQVPDQDALIDMMPTYVDRVRKMSQVGAGRPQQQGWGE